MASSSHAQSLARHDDDPLPAGERLSFRLPAVDASAAEARRRVRRQLAHWQVSQESCDNAQLVVSELVTNALRHTASTSVGCELRIAGGLLRVAVASDGPGPSRIPPRATETDEGGRGLFLVCALAEGWGIRPREAGEGHVVWADLPTGRRR